MAVVPGIADLQAALSALGLAPPRIPEAALTSIPPHTSWKFDGIPPVQMLYLYRESRLTWRIWQANVGAQFTLAGLLLGMDGALHELNWLVTPTSDRALNIYDFPLTEGFLLHFSMQMSGGSAVRGSAYSTVGLSRIVGSTRLPLALLLADNISTNGWIGWPGGFIRQSIEGPGTLRTVFTPNPAAGVDPVITVPANTRWRVLSVHFVFQTSAVVADRRVGISTFSQGGFGFRLLGPQIQRASRNGSYSCLTNIGSTVPNPEVDYVVIALPNILLLAGDTLTAFAFRLDSGDQYTSVALSVEEWIEV